MTTNVRPKVFVLYPRGLQTGGPEALHQLVQALNEVGVEAALVATPDTRELAEVEAYRHYGCPLAEDVEDEIGNFVVAPETFVRHLARFKSAQTVVWWLSIDNSPLYFREKLYERDSGPLKERFMTALRSYTSQRTLLAKKAYRAMMARSLHCTQSAYAWSHLFIREGIAASMLSDYTRLESFPIENTRIVERVGTPTVAFNPAKGAATVAAMIRERPDLNWLPVQGMDREQVIAALTTADVYLDLGHHPGKDRMPREAALCGAVVIVAQNGAGAFYADVPIDSVCKVEASHEAVENAVVALDAVLVDLPTYRRRQDSYVSWIRDERERFELEVRAFFVEGKRGYDPLENGGPKPIRR